MQDKDKRQIQGSKKTKFQSFQNLKDNKFSAYKYERNIFIGKSNEDNNDEQDYIEAEQKNIKIEEKILIKRQKQTFESQVDNLWQLWDKLGQQQKKVSELTDIENENENQFENDLLQCFGEQIQNDQSAGKINEEKKIKDLQNINIKEKDKSPKEQQQVFSEDKDLMDIWGQAQQTQQKIEQNINQNDIQDKKQSLKKKQKYQADQHYEWEQQKSKKNNGSHEILQTNQNKNITQQDDFEMELQDPNIIDLKCRNKYEQKTQYKPSITQNFLNKTAQKLQKSQIQINNVQKIQETQKQTQENYQPETNHKPSQSNKGLSIINEIIIENNTKTMTKLIPNKHYQVFDTKSFVLYPFKQNTYSYFGIESKNYSLLDQSLKINQLYPKDHTFYLYSFQTKEAFLELKPQPFDKSYIDFLSVKKTVTLAPGQKQTKKVMEYKTDLCYKIRVCSTKQHIATLFYKTIKDGYLYDLRLFDQYEHVHSQPVALIQVKDGYVNDCCYCDTNVFLEKGYLNDPQRSFFGQRAKFQIEKLKMILNMKNGKLTANMGIGGIESSPFNCCLENQQNQKFIYLMGLLIQNISQQIHFVNTYENEKIEREKQNVKKKNDFIIKVGQGVTPLIGLAIAAGRKIYIDSFQ